MALSIALVAIGTALRALPAFGVSYSATLVSYVCYLGEHIVTYFIGYFSLPLYEKSAENHIPVPDQVARKALMCGAL